MIVLSIIALVLGIPAFWLALRYNMHMFQLNGYINNEQNEWIKRNSHLQWILNFATALGLIRIGGAVLIKGAWFGIAIDILICLTL